ncbi:MAG: PepSY-associated TM helix domain-containing protein [Burkholderiaceae bacterium]
MRPDGKPEGLRQSMSWLHTWSSLLLGWLLYAVFFTGTLSYFVDEVNAWMKPESHRSVPVPDTPQRAIDGMQRLAPDATNWTLSLPGPRQTVVEASWRPHDAPAGRAGTKRADLDAATGEPIESRATRGGSFLYRFHFELHGMPRIWGRWIVGIATMAMLVAIISGVITHKKIFTDFFTFRPGKGQRSWLDAHNALAVLALPFHLVITFSGLLLLMLMLMPWGVDSVYQGDMQRYLAERRGVANAAPGAQAQAQAQAQAPARAPGEAGERGGRRGGGGGGGGSDATPVAMAPIGPMIAAAQAQWDGARVGTIVVQQPNTARASIELRSEEGRSLVDRGTPQRLVFDAATGMPRAGTAATQPSTSTAILNVTTAAHLGRFAGPSVRWLLFLSGVAGTMMVGTGMVLWVVKRLPERRKLGRTPRGHRLVEVLNVAGIAGLSLAVAAYFWSNRLLPVDLAERSDWEIRVFFIAWVASLAHAALRAHRPAWIEQFGLAAVLFATLPLLNAATGGAGLSTSLMRGQWAIAGFDLAMLALAAVHGCIAWRLLRPAKPLTRPAPRAATAAQARPT